MLSASSKDGEHLQPILSPQVETQSCVEWEPYSRLPISWQTALFNETKKAYFQKLVNFVKSEIESQTIYPPQDKIFEALISCPLEEVRVVILGQDPYHGAGQVR